jgi:3-oxoacyl-[acyl-carrier protein] reductase
VTAALAMRYEGKVVVVTGASRGLGRILAEHFLDEGARVVGISRGESSIAREGYEHLAIDIGDDRVVRATFARLARTYRAVDIVVNNAGVLTSLHAMLMPASRAEEMVRTNLLGGFYVSREAAKLMRRAKTGRIINIGSMAATLEPIYAATKAASMTLTAVLAKEFAGYGITVNTVAVTALETDMLDQLPREKVDAVIAKLPIPRLATPDDIFNVVDFFASPCSSYITAQTLFLGGVHA